MRGKSRCRTAVLFLPLWAAFAPAQDVPPAADALVTIDFPEDGIDLTLLADLVTRRLHVPILYDDTVRGKKVIVRVPKKVPESDLMGVLQSALRLKQLALVDAEQPGWKQIVPAPNLPAPRLPAPALDTRFVPLLHADAAATATAVTGLITSRDAYQSGGASPSGVSVTADDRTNQLVVVAPAARMDELVGLIAGLDKSPESTTRVYRLKTLGPERVDQLIRSLLDPAVLKRGYQAGVDRDSQSLAVSATPGVHERIDALLKELDVPAPQSSNPIQFYKLKNTKAADVLTTISGLLGGDTQQAAAAGNGDEKSPPTASPRAYAADATTPPGNTPASATPPNAPTLRSGQTTGLARTGLAGGGGGSFGAADAFDTAPRIGGLSDRSASSPGVLSVRAKDATVAADVNTNSIIVIGPPPVQQTYSDLIKRLDQRRPQVQIECTIVTLDTTDNFTFGVDIGKLGGFDSSKLLTLSSFGISTADPGTGRLTPVGGTGGTFALLSPGIADVVLRTLQTNSNARLVSAPQLLVNDNGVGKLESVSQQPYAVILDASSVQSITSLGGLASAGTSISVEPHISEADYLQLGYAIELSSFTGAAQNGLPPPSEKNSVDSEVTIPDGYTIVVGGLSTSNNVKARNTIPLLGDIPVLGWLFGTRSSNVRNTTLFVFIKPVILRDDKFEDLKYLSGKARRSAGVADDFPASAPIALR